MDLSVDLGPLRLKNPVITAAGTFGYGAEFAECADLGALGGITVKGLTREPRRGHAAPRCVETASGMLNAIGLENIGVRAFIEERLPPLRGIETALLVNIAGESPEEYGEIAGALAGADGVDAIEVNVSCPNVARGGLAFGTDPAMIGEITRVVREAAPSTPLFVKLSPNVTDIVAMARAAVDAGADGLSVANTFLGMAIDATDRRPVLGHVTGGLSGPAIKPLTLRMVWQVHAALPETPIIGIGGVMSGTDAAEYLLVGASAVAVGTASMVDPGSAVRVLRGLTKHCRRQGVSRVRDLIGALDT